MMNKQKQQKESGSQWHRLGNQDGLDAKNWFFYILKAITFLLFLNLFGLGFLSHEIE